MHRKQKLFRVTVKIGIGEGETGKGKRGRQGREKEVREGEESEGGREVRKEER